MDFIGKKIVSSKSFFWQDFLPPDRQKIFSKTIWPYIELERSENDKQNSNGFKWSRTIIPTDLNGVTGTKLKLPLFGQESEISNELCPSSLAIEETSKRSPSITLQ